MPVSRFLGRVNSQPPPPDIINNSQDIEPAVDSDFIVILAALLCALICILGLVAIARCAWFRRFSATSPPSPLPNANKGLKKKVLKSLPKHTFPNGEGFKLTECAICLTEFVEGDEIRLLPQCGHGFHVGCIDTWLGSHSSCPSCRKILVVARCHKCGEFPPSTSASAATGGETGSRSVGREQQIIQVPTFLP